MLLGHYFLEHSRQLPHPIPTIAELTLENYLKVLSAPLYLPRHSSYWISAPAGDSFTEPNEYFRHAPEMSWWWGGHYSPYPGRAHKPKAGRYLGAPRQEEHRNHHKSRHHKRRDLGYASQWQKSSSLLHHYKYIDELKKGGQSASVEVVKSVRSGKLRVLKRVTGKGRPRADLDALKRVPKNVHLNVSDIPALFHDIRGIG